MSPLPSRGFTPFTALENVLTCERQGVWGRLHPHPPADRSTTQRRSRRLSVRGAGVTWAEKQRGHSPGRGQQAPVPGGSGLPTAASRVLWRGAGRRLPQALQAAAVGGRGRSTASSSSGSALRGGFGCRCILCET